MRSSLLLIASLLFAGVAAQPAMTATDIIPPSALIQPAQLAELVKEITTLPQPRPLENRIPLWSHWASLSLLILLMALFWIGRKWSGVF